MLCTIKATTIGEKYSGKAAQEKEVKLMQKLMGEVKVSYG